MSPIAAIAPGAKADYKAESTLARLLGSGSAGIAELAVFHPVRSTIPRMRKNKADFLKGRYHCEEIDEQCWKGTEEWQMQNIWQSTNC